MAELPGEKQQGRKLTFLELIEKVLKETKSQMSPGEIWQYVTSKGYSEQLGTKGKTPWISVSSVLSVDTRLNPDSIFERVGVRPIRYRLRTPVRSDAYPLEDTIGIQSRENA